MSGDGPLPIFTNSAQFQVLSEKSFNETYIYNLDCIGKYQTNSIESMLDRRLIKTLKLIRLQLVAMVKAKFPNYQKFLNRVSKKETIDQIVSLTKGLARNEPNEDLRELFSVIKEPTIQLETLNMSDPAAVKKALIEMSSKINDLESKLDQVKCETCRDPVSSNQTHPDEEESLDQTHELEDEEESSASPQEAELPLQREVEPDHMMEAEPKTTRVFIGNVKKSMTHEKLQDYALKVKKVKVELYDIQDETARTQGKAFSVRVPVDKFNQFTANWPEGIKIEKIVSKAKKSKL